MEKPTKAIIIRPRGLNYPISESDALPQRWSISSQGCARHGGRVRYAHTSRELLERLQAQCPGIYPDGQLRTLQRRLKEWRREAAHKMVFGTATADPGFAHEDGKLNLFTNGANDCSSDCGPTSPVELPLRLDDAAASPTTPQGQHQ